MIVNNEEVQVKQGVVESKFNGLQFTPHLNDSGMDSTTPMLRETENGDMFKVVSGGGSGRTSVVAGFGESKIQGQDYTQEPKTDAGKQLVTEKVKAGAVNVPDWVEVIDGEIQFNADGTLKAKYGMAAARSDFLRKRNQEPDAVEPIEPVLD